MLFSFQFKDKRAKELKKQQNKKFCLLYFRKQVTTIIFKQTKRPIKKNVN